MSRRLGLKNMAWLPAVFMHMLGMAQAPNLVPANGPEEHKPQVYALTNATIHVSGTQVLPNATLLIEKGRVVVVGARIKTPSNAIVIDLKGSHIYPSFIDLYASYGIKPPAPAQRPEAGPRYESTSPGPVHWNESIHPETRAIADFAHNTAEAGQWREAGFGAVLTHRMDGLMRGTAALVTLDESNANRSMLKADAASMLSLHKGTSHQAYPSSLMGCIALLRQTYYDQQWYNTQPALPERNLAYEAMTANASLPQVMDAGDKYSILRADKIAREFRLQYILLGGGNEYQRTAEIKATGQKLILPLSFPDVYEINDVYDAARIPMGDLMHWEWAPFNPFKMYEAGVPFVFTTNGLRDKKDFLTQLRKAVKCGLPESYAMDALTRIPAEWMHVYDQVGSLENGKWANFIIVSGNIFTDDARITENWVQGKQYVLAREEDPEIRGTYTINIQDNRYELNVGGTPPSYTGEIRMDSVKIKTSVTREGSKINIAFIADDKVFDGSVRLSGTIHFDSGLWDGNAVLPGGKESKWSAVRKERYKPSATPKKQETDSLYTGKMLFPFKAYGYDSLYRHRTIVIQHATLWTNEKEGIIKDGQIIIREGKISYVGKEGGKYDADAWVIDAKGKHVTPGIIDEHSHIAISGGVNEGGQAISAEVSIGDVINPDDINIYRQLAGGVTTSQLLHGSANPIGGRSAIIKLRWGAPPQEMVFTEAPGFIKFALGENVKQSNWGERFNIRYPQTRMGVEQVFYDAFYRAKAYKTEWEVYNRDKSKSKKTLSPPRRDIEMDALVEILDGKRFITCHSYVQSEVNMLMHVADSMGFKVNTFTHILEGYKVADKMKAHGVSGSTFSDWWAYKFEVYDAIPYNASLLNQQGVNVGMNSDDAEMARRLNQEAAKAVKYGNTSEEDAMKMVTLNPAKMLHVDHVTGSLARGKQADIVIWSDNPLSVYAKAEKTFVDGVCYFDSEKDLELRMEIAAERERIIEKMMRAKQNGAKTQRFSRRGRRLYECDTMGNDEEEVEGGDE